MGLSEKFLRDILYARKSALGVGLMSPITIMNILALKLYAGYNRGETKVSKIIKINEENARLHYRFAAGILDTELDWNPNRGI